MRVITKVAAYMFALILTLTFLQTIAFDIQPKNVDYSTAVQTLVQYPLSVYKNGSEVFYYGSEFDEPEGLALDTENQYLYVTNWHSNNVTIFNCSSKQVVGFIQNFSFPSTISYDSYSKYLIVNVTNTLLSNWTYNSAVFDVQKSEVMHTFNNTTSMISDPANGNLYSSSGSNLTIYSGSTFQLLRVIDLGHRIAGMSYNPYFGSLLVGMDNNSLAVVNSSSYSIVKYVQLRDTTDSTPPHRIAIANDPRTPAIFATVGENYLEKVNLTSNRIIWTQNYTGTHVIFPYFPLVYDPINNLLFGEEIYGVLLIAYSGTNGMVFNTYDTLADHFEDIIYDSSDHNIYVACSSIGYGPNGIVELNEHYSSNQQSFVFNIFKAAMLTVFLSVSFVLFVYYLRIRTK